MEIIPDNVDDDGLKAAYTDADRHNWTRAELDAYEYSNMREVDERGKLVKKVKDVAQRLLTMGISHEQIAEATELTLEEIKIIANKMKS